MQDPAKKTYLMNRVEKTKEEEQLDSVVAEALSVLENKLMKVKKEKATLTAQIGKANLNPELKALLQKRLFKQSKKETKINNQIERHWIIIDFRLNFELININLPPRFFPLL